MVLIGRRQWRALGHQLRAAQTSPARTTSITLTFSLSLSLSAARTLPITCSRFSLRFPIHCHTTTPPPALSRLLRLLQAYAFPWRVGMRAESFPSAQRYVLQTLSGPVPFTGGSQGNTAWGNNKTHTHIIVATLAPQGVHSGQYHAGIFRTLYSRRPRCFAGRPFPQPPAHGG